MSAYNTIEITVTVKSAGSKAIVQFLHFHSGSKNLAISHDLVLWSDPLLWMSCSAKRESILALALVLI